MITTVSQNSIFFFLKKNICDIDDQKQLKNSMLTGINKEI